MIKARETGTQFKAQGVGRLASTAFELVKWLIVGGLALFLVHYFLFTVFIVSGESMEPNFHDREVVFINRFNLFTGNFERGDPMVLKFPGDPDKVKYIKRLIGLPGDYVEIKNNSIYINNKPLTESYIPSTFSTEAVTGVSAWQLREGEYFLVGDNRGNSSDSRTWGVARKSDMTGPVKLIVIPRFEFVATPPY
ncbi:signal peptidase I [Patescibacteria group bacterium]|nr:signal peptidase I [Patescibacteria group bacterium]